MNTTLTKWTRPSCYVGATWSGYYVAPVTRNRDSSDLENSNWDAQWAILKEQQKDIPDTDEYSPIIVSENHWACGWVEWVAIHESNVDAIRAAERIDERLENYPILDEMDFSNREMESANQVWKDCYRDKERIRYIRENRSQFQFQSFADLLACVRGKHFCGYASELMN